MSDEELIDGILEGDDESFRILVQRYHVKVINVCIGLLHDRRDAEDVAQEVFIQVFKSLNRFRRQSALATWIYRIAVNKSINFLRHSKSRRYALNLEDADSDAFAGAYSDPEETPSDILLNKELQKTLHRAIDSLPLKQRIAFSLHKYEDLSYQEVAETMETSLSAVESLIHRAKLNLQKKLSAYYKD